MPLDHSAPVPFEAAAADHPGGGRPWYSKILGFCFVIFCFEIGVFLLVFPWLRIWDANRFATYWPWMREVWASPYLRGALSGLGLVNIYISLVEMLGLIRGHLKADPERDGQHD